MCLYEPPRAHPVPGESAPQDRVGPRDDEFHDGSAAGEPPLPERAVLAQHPQPHPA